MSVHNVLPTLPTLLGDRQFLPYVDPLMVDLVDESLAHLSARYTGSNPRSAALGFSPVPSISRNLRVLSRTLHDYPHAAGRIGYDDQSHRWQIKLTNDTVPITLGTTELLLNKDLMRQSPHPEVVNSMHTPITHPSRYSMNRCSKSNS
jgi:hypothetical protein